MTRQLVGWQALCTALRLAQRQVARQHPVFVLQRNEQRALRGPRTYPGYCGECCDELLVRRTTKLLHVQAAVRQPFSEITECANLPP